MRINLLSIFLLITAIISTCHAQDNTQVGLPEGAIARLGKGDITVMRFSPNGKHLAVGTSVGVWVYDVSTGNAKALFRSEAKQVNAAKVHNKSGITPWTADTVSYIRYMAFSPDSRILAVSEADNFVTQLWDVETHKELSMLPATYQQDKAYAIAFSEDGKTLITPHYFGDVIHWDVDTGKIIKVLNTYNDHHYERIEISQDGKTYVSGCPKDGDLRLWDAANGRLLTDFEVRTKKGVNRLALSPDMITVASAHDDKTIRLREISKGTESARFVGHTERINAIAFSPDSRILVSGSEDHKIVFWDLDKKKRITPIAEHNDGIAEHNDGINALAFSPDGTILASGSSDGSIRLWSVKSRREMSILADGHTAEIKSVAFTADNTKIATAADNGSVQIWDLETKEQSPSPTFPHFDKADALALSYDVTMLASHGAETTVRSDKGGVSTSSRSHNTTNIWMLPTGDILNTLQQETETLAFSPDNNILAASTRHEIRFIDTETWDEVLNLQYRNLFDGKLLFSPNGKMLASYGRSTTTRIWDVVTQKVITPDGIKEGSALAFSPDNKLMASSYDEGLVLWDILPEGMQKHKTQIDARWGFGEVLLFSPDSKILLHATSNEKDVIQLWEVETGKDLGSLPGHAWRIYSLVFSHDGKTLASGAGDGTVLLWDWEEVLSKAQKSNGD